MSPITPVTLSRELIQALADAGLIELCPRCLTSKGLCAPCLEREGPSLKQPNLWRLLGERQGNVCPRCGSAVKVESPKDGSMWMICTGYPELCKYEHRIETVEERRARATYEAKAERRAQALARCTAAVRGKFVKNRPKRATPIPVRRVA